MSQLIEDTEPERVHDDFSHQACYVFKSSSTAPLVNGIADEDGIDDRPRKKRKSNPQSVTEKQNSVPATDDKWPTLCSGAEPLALVKLRQETFKKLWKEQEERIDDLVEAVDHDALQEIKTCVRTKKPKRGRLNTALLISGGQGVVVRQLLQHWNTAEDRNLMESKNEVLIQLQATQASNLQTALKNLIRLVVESHSSFGTYTDFLAEQKKLLPMNFDLELLRIYTSKHDIGRVIIAMSDIEIFDLSVLSELLSQLALWTDRLPFAIILGVATTVELLESRLSKATIRLLDAQVFYLGGSGDKYYDIISAVQHNPQAHLFIGPATMSVLYDMTQDQSLTTKAFKRALKYIYFSHFFANPLSVLVCSSDRRDILGQEQNSKVLSEAIRNTTSFQSHCTALLDSDPTRSSTVESLLNNDSYTLSYTLDNLTTSCEHQHKSHAAISLFITLYTSPSLNLPHISACELHSQLAQFLLSSSRPLSSATIYADLISSLRLLSTTGLTTLLTAIDAPKDITTVSSLVSLFSTITPPPPSTFSLPESHTCNLRHPLTSTFSPRPRYAIERALSQPADYLGCDCCMSDQRSEPTSILYSLLNEAGRDINVRDLWETFYSILAPTLATSREVDGGAGTAGGNDDGESGEKNTHMHALALFYRSLAELKMMGLVKSVSSKRKGVDVISKTTWKGL